MICSFWPNRRPGEFGGPRYAKLSGKVPVWPVWPVSSSTAFKASHFHRRQPKNRKKTKDFHTSDTHTHLVTGFAVSKTHSEVGVGTQKAQNQLN